MRHAPRGPKLPPPSLSKPNKSGLTEFDLALRHYEPQPPSTPPKKAYDFAAYKADDVKARLEELFHGKCAYCESDYAATAPVDVEHYRPKGGIEGERDHPGYWWLAATWENLLPSCIFCNRRQKQRTPIASASLIELQRDAASTGAMLEMNSGKRNCFPIAGPRAANRHASIHGEIPLLLNPAEDRPEQHIAFNLDPEHVVAVVFPVQQPGGTQLALAGNNLQAGQIAAHADRLALSVRGAVSIQVYGLNRLGLVQQRTRVLRTLEFLGSLLIDLAALRERVADELAKARTALLVEVDGKLQDLEQRIYAELGAMKSDQAPYCSMVAAWLNSFRERIGAS